MLRLSSKFQKISPCSFLSRGRFITILAHFLKIWPKNIGPSLCKNKFDDIFFFHPELSLYAMLRLLTKFQKISPCSFLSRGRYITILSHFIKIWPKNMGPSLCKNKFDDIFFFFHHELSYVMLSLLSKFQKISPCSFLGKGRFIAILAHFLKISL